MSNPWCDWFTELLSGDMQLKLHVAASPRGDLLHEEPEIGQRVLDARLNEVHVPSIQGVSLVKKLLSSCAAHALAFYESTQCFLKRIAQEVIELNPEPPVYFITGPAGRGKSALLHAVKKMMPARAVRPSEELPSFPVMGILLLRVDGRTKRKDLLNALATLMGFPADYKTADHNEVQRMRGQLYKAGVMMIIVDELQFWSTSLTAHASVTSGLYFLRSLGVPLAFIGNFSLGKKLLARPPEDVQRLLADVTTVLPLSVSDPHFENVLKEYKSASGGAISVTDEESKQLRWYTVENLRALRILCGIAFRFARAAGRNVVRMSDFSDAYNTETFSSFRRLIEVERTFIVTGQRPKRSGVVSPFELREDERADWVALHNEVKVILAQAAKARAQLKPTERAGLEVLERAARGSRDGVPEPKMVVTPDRLSALLSSRPALK